MNTSNFDNLEFRKLFPLTEENQCGIPNRAEVIDQYLAGELSDSEIQAYDEHTFYCETCSDELQFRIETIGILKRQESLETKTARIMPLFKRIKTQSWPVIAVAAVLLIALFSWDQIQRQQIEEQRRLFAANSKPSSFYEDMLKDQFRSDVVTVTLPDTGFNVKDDLVFSYEGGEGIKVFIKIFNNKEEELLMLEPDGNTFVFENVPQKLEPGLYYWKLEDEDEMLYLGKFYVKKP